MTRSKEYRSDFDWARFWVRFGIGALPGLLFGFGFWIPMCRPRRTLGTTEHVPRLITKWLHPETTIASGRAGITVSLIFRPGRGRMALHQVISHLRIEMDAPVGGCGLRPKRRRSPPGRRGNGIIQGPPAFRAPMGRRKKYMCNRSRVCAGR